ncbi:MAG: polysaccharide pyruvyl transferase family protein, partial [Eubacteriales bacterium]|nr:polysaccharide pyruvyl transferase family protein [Eubacteriales bacterium]
YLAIIKFAKLFRKRVMLYSNGIGPVVGKRNRKLVKLVVDNVDLITLREEFSAKDLADIGVKKPEIHITADAAFTLKSVSDERAREIIEKEEIPLDKEMIGISVRQWNKAKYGEKYIKEIAKACDNMAKDGKTIIFIPMEFPKDAEVSKKIMHYMEEKSFIIKGNYKPNEVLGIVGQMNLIVGMRLHILLFAALKKIPMIGIVYDPKIEYYLDVLNMPKGGDVRTEEINSKKLTNQIKGMFLGLERYQDILEQKLEILLEKASQNEKLLNEQFKIIRKEKGSV